MTSFSLLPTRLLWRKLSGVTGVGPSRTEAEAAEMVKSSVAAGLRGWVRSTESLQDLLDRLSGDVFATLQDTSSGGGVPQSFRQFGRSCFTVTSISYFLLS